MLTLDKGAFAVCQHGNWDAGALGCECGRVVGQGERAYSDVCDCWSVGEEGSELRRLGIVGIVAVESGKRRGDQL